MIQSDLDKITDKWLRTQSHLIRYRNNLPYADFLLLTKKQNRRVTAAVALKELLIERNLSLESQRLEREKWLDHWARVSKIKDISGLVDERDMEEIKTRSLFSYSHPVQDNSNMTPSTFSEANLKKVMELLEKIQRGEVTV